MGGAITNMEPARRGMHAYVDVDDINAAAAPVKELAEAHEPRPATSLVASAVYYIVLGKAWLTLRGIDPDTARMEPEAWQMAGQLARNLVVAFVLAYLLSRLGATTPTSALRVGLLVWLGFEAMAVVGSVLHEGYPLGLYLIHVGDALQVTLVMALILGAWGRDARRDVEIGPSASTSS